MAAANSALQLIELSPLSTAYIHNGGALAFGTDGKLYIATGENADSTQAQSLNVTHGKLLRINPDGSIPEDNPFLGQTTGVNQAIWARGLRNPYTFAIDPTTGRIHVNDVGQDAWEEVNHAVAGANFGWPQTEGFTPGGVAGTRYPAYVYANAGTNCAIVGATFYRPAVRQFPASTSAVISSVTTALASFAHSARRPTVPPPDSRRASLDWSTSTPAPMARSITWVAVTAASCIECSTRRTRRRRSRNSR